MSNAPWFVRWFVPCWLMMPWWYEEAMRRLGYERTQIGVSYGSGDAYASDRSGGDYSYTVPRFGWRKI